MCRFAQNARDALGDLPVYYPNSFDQFPREEPLDQELRLLVLPHHQVFPVRRGDRIPVQLVQLPDVIEE